MRRPRRTLVAHWIARVEEVAGKLGRKKRAAFLGFYVKQLSYEELAERLNETGTTSGTFSTAPARPWRPRLPMRGFLGRTLGLLDYLRARWTAGDSAARKKRTLYREKGRGL